MEILIIVHDRESKSRKEHLFSKASIRIGRGPSNDVVVDSPQVSGKHLSLKVAGPQLTVRDEKSRNGTYVLDGEEWRRVAGEYVGSLPLALRLANTVTILVRPRVKGPQEADFPHPESGSYASAIAGISVRENQEAIMVLDLCGSSDLAFKNDRMAYHLKKRLETISRSILELRHVDFYKGTGDGFVATFADPVNALKSACLILRQLSERNAATKNPPILVRIGLHYGTTYVIDESTRDRHGNDLNIAFRLEGLKSGQMEGSSTVKLPETHRAVSSAEFRSAVAAREASFSDMFAYLGTAGLKGIGVPVNVFLIDTTR